MTPNVPIIIPLLFAIVTVATLILFNRVIKNASNPFIRQKATLILIGLVLWLIVQGTLALTHVYTSHLDMTPPMLFLLGLLPAVLLILWLFLSNTGRTFLDSLPLKQLAYLNIIRIPIEIGLFGLYIYGTVPKLMTFEGGNLDILSGISTPLVAYYMFKKQAMKPKIFLAWHILCLALLANIVARALLSAPFPFQKLAFDQPNIAIINFPFVWLPTFMVMTVLFGHLASIRKILANKAISHQDALRKKTD
jgi:hypothetical protein